MAPRRCATLYAWCCLLLLPMGGRVASMQGSLHVVLVKRLLHDVLGISATGLLAHHGVCVYKRVNVVSGVLSLCEITVFLGDMPCPSQKRLTTPLCPFFRYSLKTNERVCFIPGICMRRPLDGTQHIHIQPRHEVSFLKRLLNITVYS